MTVNLNSKDNRMCIARIKKQNQSETKTNFPLKLIFYLYSTTTQSFEKLIQFLIQSITFVLLPYTFFKQT